MKGWRGVVLLWVVAAAAIFGVWRNHTDVLRAVAAPQTPAAVGKPLPDFTVRRLDGSLASIRSFEGRPLWLNFFATWCPPCNREMPEIERYYRKDQARGLVVLALDQEEDPLLVRRFVASRGLTFPVGIDPGAAAADFSIVGLPVSVFVDREGIVRRIRFGELGPQEMQSSLALIGGSV
ncbi:MAG: TlpA family protein disulfide reductase [Vulcanimicrobiaceae bacterium]